MIVSTYQDDHFLKTGTASLESGALFVKVLSFAGQNRALRPSKHLVEEVC